MKSLATLTKGTLVIALAAVFVNAGYAQTQPKPATEATKAANRALQQYLNFNDRDDFDNATRGLISKPDALTIKGEKSNVVWDLEAYKAYISIDKPAPDTCESEPVAQLAAHHAIRAVQGARQDFSGTRLRSVQHHLCSR